MLVPCFCGREARGFYYQRPAVTPRLTNKRTPVTPPKPPPPKVRCCSMACLDVAHNRRGAMPDMSKFEKIALAAVSAPAGAYIEATGSTDMATWPVETWDGFLECVVTSFAQKMRELADSGDCPF
jgi:hypothetical protein